jgi:hypothetical protein
MKSNFYLLIVMALLHWGCKKQKPITYSGRLLLSSKFPVPLANRKIAIYQPGSSSAIGLSSGSTAASATAQTDANGNFQLVFTPGTASFLVFSGTNSSPLTLRNSSGETTFPGFYRENFPDSGYDASKPIFVGKTIDTAIIKAILSSDLTPADTIGLRATTISGNIDKAYTGRSGNTNAIIVLDTIYNMLLTDFDCRSKKFRNTLYAGRKWTTTWGYVTISSYGVVSPYRFSAMDEAKQEILFFFQK